jgi:hypothetical protein
LKKRVDDQEARIKEFVERQSDQLAELLANKAARYMMAARKLRHGPEATAAQIAAAEGLDQETLERWVSYLGHGQWDHPYLKKWQDLERTQGTEAGFQQTAAEFQEQILAAIREKKSVDEQNLIRLGGSRERGNLANANLVSINYDQYLLWSDLFRADHDPANPRGRPRGILYYQDGKIDRFLNGEWKSHLEDLRAALKRFQSELPEAYPFLHTIESSTGGRGRRGGANAPEEVPPRFLTVLCEGKPQPFEAARARLQLAEAIVSPRNPLTARVMVNRIWLHHFGAGLVRTPGNFGQLGDRPTHPELLDFLAARFVENRWSIKAMHREIMLSATYALSAEISAANNEVDPENRLLWRAHRRRLDAESLRDAMLSVTGELDPSIGGAPAPLGQIHTRRTLYSFISRRKPDPTLAMFDFPNPNQTMEQRHPTSTPLQGLYFLNSDFVGQRATAFASMLASEAGDAARIRKAYRVLYYRDPTREEVQMGLEFLGNASWQRYAQVLLTSNEFIHQN